MTCPISYERIASSEMDLPDEEVPFIVERKLAQDLESSFIEDPYLLPPGRHYASMKKSKDWNSVVVPHFVPSWEGLRGIAVLMTCYSHIDRSSGSLHHYAGVGGVAIFFVLSGFLITGVLIKMQEKLNDNRSRFKHLQRFYMDRSVRLYPALLLMVFCTGLSYIIFRNNRRTPDNFWYHTFYTLFYMSDLHQPSLRGKNWTLWVNTWSLSVEEQFYLIWSIILPFLIKLETRRKCMIISVLCLSSLIIHLIDGARIVKPGYWLMNYDNPFRNFWKMLVGALLRIAPLPSWTQRSCMAWFGLSILFVSLLLSASPVPIDLTSLGFGRAFSHYVYHELIATLATTIIILGTLGKGNVLLEGKGLRFVGKVSYSFYLYQSPLLMFVPAQQRGFIGLAVTALAFIAAIISTLYFEEPIRDWYKYQKQHEKV